MSADAGKAGVPRCDRCGAVEGVEIATVTDDSGGAHVHLCGECRDDIRRPRCHLCGGVARAARKACVIYLENRGDAVGAICDDCRNRLLRTRRWSA